MARRNGDALAVLLEVRLAQVARQRDRVVRCAADEPEGAGCARKGLRLRERSRRGLRRRLGGLPEFGPARAGPLGGVLGPASRGRVPGGRRRGAGALRLRLRGAGAGRRGRGDHGRSCAYLRRLGRGGVRRPRGSIFLHVLGSFSHEK